MRPTSTSLPSGAVLTLDLFDGEPKDSSLAWTDGENSEAVVIKSIGRTLKLKPILQSALLDPARLTMFLFIKGVSRV